MLLLFSALPVTFKQEVENLVVKEGDSGEFCCELSKPGAPVDWRKGRVVLKPGYKYEMKLEGRLSKLIINNIEESDAGKYTCKTSDSQSTAELTVRGQIMSLRGTEENISKQILLANSLCDCPHSSSRHIQDKVTQPAGGGGEECDTEL